MRYLSIIGLFLGLLTTYAIGQSFPSGTVLHCTATDPSGTCRLTNDGAGASAPFVNCVNVPNNTVYALTVDVVAIDTATVANTTSWNNWTMLLNRGASAATTTIHTATKPTALTNGTATGTDISATADTTLGCLNLTFTSASTVDTSIWDVTAKISVVQVK